MNAPALTLITRGGFPQFKLSRGPAMVLAILISLNLAVGAQAQGFGADRGETFGREPAPFGGEPGTFGREPAPFGGEPDSFGRKPDTFGREPNTFGREPINQEETSQVAPTGVDQGNQVKPEQAGKEDETSAKAGKDEKKQGKWAIIQEGAGRFRYQMPNGWALTRNPFVATDVLVKEAGDLNKSIVFEVRRGRPNMKARKVLEKQMQEKLKTSKVLENLEVTLGSDKKSGARLSLEGETKDFHVWQTAYLIDLGRGSYLVMTGSTPLTADKELADTLARMADTIEATHQKISKIVRK